MGLDSFMGPPKKTKKSSKKKSRKKKTTVKVKKSTENPELREINSDLEEDQLKQSDSTQGDSKFVKVDLICTNSKCKYKKSVKRIGGAKEKDLICPKCNSDMKITKK